MATLPTHALVGAALVLLANPRQKKRSLAFAAAFLAMLPDADVVSFRLGIPYAAEWGHRGASHSLLFSALVALPFAWWLAHPSQKKGPAQGAEHGGFWEAWVLLALAGISHGLLDALTNGGLGIAFFWPWEQTRYFLPWQPIQVSPIGLGALGPRLLKVFANEALWIWLPCAALLTLNTWIQKERHA